MSILFILNGKTVSSGADPQTPLLEVLRNDFELNGPKFGCGLAQCGACSVLLEGRAVRSCVLPLAAVNGQQVTTLEGLGNEKKPHPLQIAFIEQQAMQCGYCTNGMIVNAAALLAVNARPDRAAIKQALSGILCRCGSHLRIIKAIEQAASLQDRHRQ